MYFREKDTSGYYSAAYLAEHPGYREIEAMVDGVPVVCLNSFKDKDRNGEPFTYVNARECREYDLPNFYDNDSRTVAEAKVKIRRWYEENKAEVDRCVAKANGAKSQMKMAYLPSGDGDGFFPTPSALAGKMLAKVDWRGVHTVLEPSAGKGNLIDAMVKLAEQEKYRSWRKCTEKSLRVSTNFSERTALDCTDAIEADINLQSILLGKGIHLVGDDFLSFTTRKRYDAIIMNPPFAEGDKHLLKALELQKNGGQIVCLLNAETIRNPYTHTRYLLKQKLAEYNATIEFVQGAFKHAERPSDVEVAIVYVNIPCAVGESNILDGLKKARKASVEEEGAEPTAMTSGNWIEEMVAAFNMEADAGVELMREYAALAPYIMNDSSYSSEPLIRLKVGNREISKFSSEGVEEYLKLLRGKYWRLLLNRPELRDRMTSKMQDEYSAKVNSMKDYDFSVFNVKRFVIEITAQLQQGVMDSIMSLFTKLSSEHSWYPESQQNIHYFNGWRTNEAHKVGMKAIIPVNGAYATNWRNEQTTLSESTCGHVISDMEKVLDFLDGGRTAFHANVGLAIQRANAAESKKAEFTYFDCTFYKKGTCHIKFHDDAKHLIDRLNIIAAKNRGWLPPNYGKVSYEAMDDEERAVVDDFQGRAEYERICADASYYLADVQDNSFALPA